MNSETILRLDLDERNLSHFLSALALTAFAQRVEGDAVETRRCWWPEQPAQFAIQTEMPADDFRAKLFEKADTFLRSMEWVSGLGGASSGILVSGDEIGVNPFVGLSGQGVDNTPFKIFAGNQSPDGILKKQIQRLPTNRGDADWLHSLAQGKGSWRYDWRVNQHASDAGISSNAEKTGDFDPFYPAIELLAITACAFFAPIHAWQTSSNSLKAFAWKHPCPLPMAAIATSGKIHGLPGSCYQFAFRDAAHGDRSKYKYFPPAILKPQNHESRDQNK